MTYYEKIIASAYTGTMFVHGGQLGDVYEYIERTTHSAVFDLKFACDEFNAHIKNLIRDDFLKMLDGTYANMSTPDWCRYENTPFTPAPAISHK